MHILVWSKEPVWQENVVLGAAFCKRFVAVWQTVTVFRLFRILWKLSYIKHVYIIRKNCKPKHEVTHVTLHLCWMGGGCHPHGWLHSQLNTWCKMIVGTRCSFGGKFNQKRKSLHWHFFFLPQQTKWNSLCFQDWKQFVYLLMEKNIFLDLYCISNITFLSVDFFS